MKKAQMKSKGNRRAPSLDSTIFFPFFFLLYTPNFLVCLASSHYGNQWLRTINRTLSTYSRGSHGAQSNKRWTSSYSRWEPLRKSPRTRSALNVSPFLYSHFRLEKWGNDELLSQTLLWAVGGNPLSEIVFQISLLRGGYALSLELSLELKYFRKWEQRRHKEYEDLQGIHVSL